MLLWFEILRCTAAFKSACKYHRTFLWLVAVIIAWLIRPDLFGVSSFIRASFLNAGCYNCLLNFFQSPSLNLLLLLAAWVNLTFKLFIPLQEAGYMIFVADGLKVPKEGKKMPGVKSLHQESTNNSKAEFIMGHSFQAISLLVTATTGQVFAVPLVARICEGLVFKKTKHPQTLLDKLVHMFLEITFLANCQKAILVADAYYASQKIIKPLLGKGYHLISRVKKTSVAYACAPQTENKGPGRKKKYGKKIILRNLFKGWKAFEEAPSPVYGETGVTIQYRVVNLLWKPVGQMVRFVLVKHPTRGNIILICTQLELPALSIIKIYGYRFKIEVSFRQAIHTIGAYAYHFWMKRMDPIHKGGGDQVIVGRTTRYQNAVVRKMDTYHRYVQIACIVQGLLQHLAINYRQQVWLQFKSWFRTMKQQLVPSELVVAHALKSAFPEFLLDKSLDHECKKFIIERADPEKIPGFNMTT